MKPTAKTIGLAAIAVVFAALNLLDSGSGQRIAAQLPHLASIDKTMVQTIELTSVVEKIILKRITPDEPNSPGRWEIVAPIKAEADAMLIRSLLNNFRKEAPIDVRVDSENLEEYGLDASNAVVVEIFTESTDPDISFSLGFDAPGGSSFLRLSRDDNVYRGRLGGRHRYERPASEWRNRVILGITEKDVIDAVLTHKEDPNTSVHIARNVSTAETNDGPPILGDWTLDPDPGWPVDQLAVNAMFRTIGSMRAGDIMGEDFNGGFDPPATTVQLTLLDGTNIEMDIGTRILNDSMFVRRRHKDQTDSIYRVSRSSVSSTSKSKDDFQDKTLFSFSRSDVDTISLHDDSTIITLQQDLANRLWRVLEPANMDVDVKLVFFAVNTMASLRANEISDITMDEAGLTNPTSRIVVRLLDGSTVSLELGNTTTSTSGHPAIYARRANDDRVAVLLGSTIKKLKQGFGRQ